VTSVTEQCFVSIELNSFGIHAARPRAALSMLNGLIRASIEVNGAMRSVEANPPRLVFAEQLGGRSPAGFILETDVGELLAVMVADNKTRGAFRRHGETNFHKRNCFARASRTVRSRNLCQFQGASSDVLAWPSLFVGAGRSQLVYAKLIATVPKGEMIGLSSCERK
jgi:hypothetical protein